jgi:hypothetical protein
VRGDGVREELDADGGEHGLQREQNCLGFGRVHLLLQDRDRDLGDGGRNFFGRDGRGEIEALAFQFERGRHAQLIGWNSQTPQQCLGEAGAGDLFGDFVVCLLDRVGGVLRCDSAF